MLVVHSNSRVRCKNRAHVAQRVIVCVCVKENEWLRRNSWQGKRCPEKPVDLMSSQMNTVVTKLSSTQFENVTLPESTISLT